MKRNFPFFTLLIFLNIWSCKQPPCDCQNEFDFVKNHMETNLPGFKDNVNESNVAAYEIFKQDIYKMANTENENDCLKALNFYVEFFKDNHTGIFSASEGVDENDKNAVAAFLKSKIYTETETIEITDDNNQQFPIDKIEGIYSTLDSTYVILVIPSKNDFRDYVGVILESKSNLWKRGQVKIELKYKSPHRYEAFVYMRDHSMRYRGNYVFRNGILGGLFYKTNLKDKTSHHTSTNNQMEFKVIDDEVSYIRIPSFGGYLTAELDSFYQVHFPTIKKHPYLIIDVMDNGGGNDINVNPLLEFMYAEPIISNEVLEMYVTEENTRKWQEVLTQMQGDTNNYSKETINWVSDEVTKMKNAEWGTFIPRGETNDTITYEEVLTAPKQVAILYNNGCASSCETILFLGMKSSKTILVGENSGGYVGYGEVTSIETPHYGFILNQTLTRYKNGRKYEATGISPDYQLKYDRNWIDQTVEILKSK